jgi:chloramphenicol 3-O phosphotransferase
MAQGKIIFLNGASSSGKTVIAHTLQGILDQVYLHFSIDGFMDLLLQRYISAEGGADLTPEKERALLALIPGIVSGFHRCTGTLASSGMNLIVDHVLQDPGWLRECVELLADQEVLFVGVHCPLEELERRETEREREPGTARQQVEIVHHHGIYDVEVDTSSSSPMECARQVEEGLRDIARANAFRQLRERFESERER